MFDDNFPTFDGLKDRSSARQMLDKVNPQDFRTVIRNNADGSTTVLRTRGGHPEFSTTTPAVQAAMDYYEPDYTARTYWDVTMSMWNSVITFKYLKSVALKDSHNNPGLLEFPQPPETGGDAANFWAPVNILAANRILSIRLYPNKKATLFGAAITLPDPAVTSETNPPGAYANATLLSPRVPAIAGSLPRVMDYGVNILTLPSRKRIRFAVPIDG